MKLRQTLQGHQDSEPISASHTGTALSSRSYPAVQAAVDNSPRVIAQSKTLDCVVGNEQPTAAAPESIAQETSSIANMRSAPIQFMLTAVRSLTNHGLRAKKQISKSIAGHINNNNSITNNILNNKPNKSSEYNKKSSKKINHNQNTQHINSISKTNEGLRRNYASSLNNNLTNRFKDNPSETDFTSTPKEENKEDINKKHEVKIKPLTSSLEKQDNRFLEEGHLNETEGLKDEIRATQEKISAHGLHDQSSDKEVCVASTPQSSTESEYQDHRTREPVPNTKTPAPGDVDFIEQLLRYHSRYPDGTPVFEGQQPSKVGGPLSEAPHSVIKWDKKNRRIYKAREYGQDGVPIRDIDFTNPTFGSGKLRPDHYVPEQHRYTPNDPNNPKAGYKRGPGEPLRMP